MNPDAVKGHEGQHVSLHADFNSDKNGVRVTGIDATAADDK